MTDKIELEAYKNNCIEAYTFLQNAPFKKLGVRNLQKRASVAIALEMAKLGLDIKNLPPSQPNRALSRLVYIVFLAHNLICIGTIVFGAILAALTFWFLHFSEMQEVYIYIISLAILLIAYILRTYISSMFGVLMTDQIKNVSLSSEKETEK